MLNCCAWFVNDSSEANLSRSCKEGNNEKVRRQDLSETGSLLSTVLYVYGVSEKAGESQRG